MIESIPFNRDPLLAAAQQILTYHQDQLPDLSHCQILVADSQCAAGLRAALLDEAEKRGFTALLGPNIERLDGWLLRYSNPDQTILQRPAQELILGEALRHAHQLYTDTDPWLLADQLLSLFEDLTHNQYPLAGRLDDFQKTLQQAYGLPQPSASLQQEAYILHTLWHAWRQQLEDENATDPASAYLSCLQRSLEQALHEELWLLGFTGFSSSELEWLQHLLEGNCAHLLLHGSTTHTGNHPDAALNRICTHLGVKHDVHTDQQTDAYAAFMETLYATDSGHLKQRAEAFTQRFPVDPVTPGLRTLCTDNPEMEAQAVALQVRRWLLDGHQPIAIVSEDRRLARRVRAMLEASEIQLDDPAGWALSTTSAAAIVERWLETVEEDFACGPMLDVLKSPFLKTEHRDQHLALVRRLEQDIVLHENIARGLARYRRHLDLRSERLAGDWSEHTRRDLHALLNQLNHAAAPLTALLNGNHTAQVCIEALCSSLLELGIWPALEDDLAGQNVIETLTELGTAAASFDTQLNWQELRAWVGRSFERATFRIPGGSSAVKLLTLEQTRLQRFAGIVIAGCSREYLPGSPAGQAFFNQQVRAQLGLPTWSEQLATRLHHFVRILHSSDQLLLTRHSEVEGEPVPISPWLELLETFHANAYAGSLEDTDLKALLGQTGTTPASPDATPLPTSTQRPQPVVPAALQPHTWSASTHQRLIDCPYRFYAADVLGLKPQESISEALSRADYGALIHRVLEAFHSDIKRLPGPWSGPLDASQREPAIQLLEDISQTVFNRVIADDFEARGWLQQWRACIPAYIDWQIRRQQDWQVHAIEISAEKTVGEWLFKGRIDRIDRHQSQLGILDYKTGKPPSAADVLCGEAVQLPSYALMLDEPVTQLDYLQIGKAEVKSATNLPDEDVPALVTAVGSRLADLQQALQCNAPLPAWGDDKTCHWCEFSGVCRRAMWQDEAQADD